LTTQATPDPYFDAKFIRVDNPRGGYDVEVAPGWSYSKWISEITADIPKTPSPDVAAYIDRKGLRRVPSRFARPASPDQEGALFGRGAQEASASGPKWVRLSA
jgi:hypothetical protein